MKSSILDNVKNVIGWKTKRRIVVFVVDDYGNVRLHDKEARLKLTNAGLNLSNRFDQYDALETVQDLEALMETLASVKDLNGRSAVFTPYALSCNIDFDKMRQEQYSTYQLEKLPVTFQKMAEKHPTHYSGAFRLWKEGIGNGLLRPQFHGREHFNLKVFQSKLANRDKDLLTSLQNNSLAGINDRQFKPIGWTQSFAFQNPKEDTTDFLNLLSSGLSAFEEVYGYKATAFTPPAQQFPDQLLDKLPDLGIRYFDRPFHQKKHLGFGKYKNTFSSTGYNPHQKLTTLVRNVVFEPSSGKINHVEKAISQIATAFKWNRPAIISSHRVNFCGFIDENNRKMGIDALSLLLKRIVNRWPEVEFMAVDALGELIENRKK